MNTVLSTALLFGCTPPPAAPVTPAGASSTSAAPGAELERTIAGPGMRLVFRASGLANLIYHLDCLSERIRCSLPAYEALWRAHLGWTAEDGHVLQQWRALRDRYGGEIVERDTTEAELLLPFAGAQIDIGARQRVAGLMATDLEDYERGLSLLMRDDDAQRASALIRRMLPRFTPWWEASGLPAARRFMDDSAELVRTLELLELFDSIKAFYEAELPSQSSVLFHLMVRPASDDPSSHAEQLENHSVLEVLPGEDPRERIDVVSHELFHYFFARMPQGRRAALDHQIAQASDARAVVAYALMNEALATAFGNGLVGRRALSAAHFDELIQKELGLYAEPHIDRAAKALLPGLPGALERGLTLSSAAFVSSYVSLVSATLPADPGPLLRLKPFAAAGGPRFKPNIDALRRSASAEAAYLLEPIDADVGTFLRKYPLLSAVLMLSREELVDVSAAWVEILPPADVERLRDAARSRPALVYAAHRSEASVVFVFVADEPQQMQQLVDAFVGLVRTGKGVIVGL